MKWHLSLWKKYSQAYQEAVEAVEVAVIHAYAYFLAISVPGNILLT